MTLPTIRYRKTEYLIPWRFRKVKPVDLFILDIPYGLYFSVVPGLQAINELLQVGTAGGGMGTGVTWEPFTITHEQYDEICDRWRNFDLRSLLKIPASVMPDLSFVFDPDIMSIPTHHGYLKAASAKYATRYFGKSA
jgi:hypothetical protein